MRLASLDTEESWPGGSKPVTEAGRRASQWAKQWSGVNAEGFPEAAVVVDIQFDTHDPVSTCKRKHRGNFGRLLCYVFKEEVNYNLEAVKQGWRPYFVKNGRSRLYHEAFIITEAIRILRLVNNRYAGQGRGYVYVTGEASRYPDNNDGRPQVVLTDAAQLSDLHSG